MTPKYNKTRTQRAGSGSPGRSLDLTVPYWFSSTARGRQENLLPGDYVSVRGLGKDKYELMEIFWKYASVRVRQVGHVESMTMPWAYITPFKEASIRSKTVMQAVGDWLFRGNRVYRISEPDRMLKTMKIHWDRESSDVQDEQGRVYYDIAWDDLEFWNPEDYHFPDESN